MVETVPLYEFYSALITGNFTGVADFDLSRTDRSVVIKILMQSNNFDAVKYLARKAPTVYPEFRVFCDVAFETMPWEFNSITHVPVGAILCLPLNLFRLGAARSKSIICTKNVIFYSLTDAIAQFYYYLHAFLKTPDARNENIWRGINHFMAFTPSEAVARFYIKELEKRRKYEVLKHLKYVITRQSRFNLERCLKQDHGHKRWFRELIPQVDYTVLLVRYYLSNRLDYFKQTCIRLKAGGIFAQDANEVVHILRDFFIMIGAENFVKALLKYAADDLVANLGGGFWDVFYNTATAIGHEELSDYFAMHCQ